MDPHPQGSAERHDRKGSLVVLALLSIPAGAATGFLGALFRLSLEKADRLRDALVQWAHGEWVFGALALVALCAAATGVAAFIVRRFSPQAVGSGIPHVEAVVHGETKVAGYGLIPVKFFGGLLAIGSGLALGREGPSVQIGAGTGHLVAKLFRRNDEDLMALLTAGAGAGLATAFNAPIAGAAFVLEEVVRRFDTRITVATLGASAGAIAVARVLIGDAPDFQVASPPYVDLVGVSILVVLGALAGLLGVFYNRLLLAMLGAMERLRGLPVEARAALVGALVGVAAWFVPGWVGGGDAITQRTLDGTGALAILPFVFLFRFGLGPVSYAARTPGGLFAPLLVLGAQVGLLFGIVSHHWMPTAAPDTTAFAVVGMAAFFAATVRAPLTGILLVTEMTASFSLLLPMLAACLTAVAVPTMLRNQPIYDSLRMRNYGPAQGDASVKVVTDEDR